MHGHGNLTTKQTEEVCPEVHRWFGTTFTNNKAGMAEVDKDKVKRVVYEMSKARHSYRPASGEQHAFGHVRDISNPYAGLRLACAYAGHSSLQAWPQAAGPDRGEDQKNEAAGARTDPCRAVKPHKVGSVLPCAQNAAWEFVDTRCPV